MKDILSKLFDYYTLSTTEAREILTQISSGKYNDTQIAVFLAVFQMRAITLEELTGFREALQDLSIRIDLSEFNTIDVCGTGGDGKNTFNISTLTSFVVAGTGQKVAKHGNYGVSSSCGSSNVLEYFGYAFSNDKDKLRKELDQAGICFLHAPLFNPAMKQVAPVRRQLGLKTFFNILGPMINPSSPQNQLIGVYSLELARMYGYVYQNSDINYSVIHSLDGYDEISLTAPFRLISRHREEIIDPRDLSLPEVKAEDIQGGKDVKESAEIFLNLLKGAGTRSQNSVINANAALALQVIDDTLSFPDALQRAEDSLLSGKARLAFNKLIELNQ